MKNKDMPAMPQNVAINDTGDCEYSERAGGSGLTKREMFAMHAMSAWINHHGSAGGYGFSNENAASSAVASADALLAELDK